MLPQTLSITPLSLKDDKPIYQQIITFLEEQITSGKLKEGMLLPSTRHLSRQLQVHRNTVTEAYERLITTGWLYTEEKRGTFVASPKDISSLKITPAIDTLYSFHKFSYLHKPTALPMKRHYSLKFDEGNTDPNMAPILDLAIAYKRSYSMHLRLQKTDLMPQYPDHSELMNELDRTVGHYCGVRLDNDHSLQIMGIQNALYLVAQTLIDKGDAIVVETPGNPLAWEVFHACGAKVLPIVVDQDGLNVAELKHILATEKVKAVYVTPQVQYPTTVTLSQSRREELLQLAVQHCFAILEADYDYEYWYDEKKILPLISADKHGSVIYLNCLSNIMAPLSWIGLVTGPRSFIDSLKVLATSLDHQGEVVLETAVTRMIKDGIITRQVRKSINAYKAKRDAMISYLNKYLYGKAQFFIPAGGLACWVTFKEYIDLQAVLTQLSKEDIYMPDGDKYFFDNKPANAIRLGFASLKTDRIEAGIKAIAEIIKANF